MSQSNSKDLTKQLDFVKQQQQLRALGNVGINSNPKSLSADSMIEDLLSKKETFQKRSTDTQQKQELPGWLTSNVHPLYERVWVGLKLPGGVCDTPLLSPLLMSSGLSTDTLGYIWSVANRTVPGYLTQAELYLALALVGLAQTGYVVNNLAAVYQLPQPPVPSLDLKLLPSRAAAPIVFPSPLNVTTLPDPAPFNWVSTEVAPTSSPDKIGISYVSSGPMVSPKLLSDQTRVFKNPKPQISHTPVQSFHQQTPPTTTNLNITEFNINDSSGQKSILGSNKSSNFNFDPKTISTSKHSSNAYSFSFPSLNESPSHIKHVQTEEQDPFDDEFTDFQSAEFTSISSSKMPRKSSITFDDDEFTHFQKASPQFDDALSVLVVDGNTTPSAQELWVEDDSSIVQRNNEKFSSTENRVKDVLSGVPNMFDEIEVASKFDSILNNDKNDIIQSKYSVFNEIEGDKYSVFHNPLPDDDAKYSTSQSNTTEKEFTEPKSAFKHYVFGEPEASLNLFRSDHQAPSLELPEPYKHDNRQKELIEDDNDEFSNFQNFPVSMTVTDNVGISENDDKYNVFRTIVFQGTVSQQEDMEVTKPNKSSKDNSINRHSFDSKMYVFGNVNSGNEQEDDSLNIESGKPSDEDFNLDDPEFGDFQESSSLPPKSEPIVESLFSSLAISESAKVNPINVNDSSSFKPPEDKYKALRHLEPTSGDTEEFGEFSGTDFVNSGNEHQTQVEQPSVQMRCLEACLNLLKDGLLTLSKASTPEVVSEVLIDPRASTYLDCLMEVQRVSERILRHMEDERCAAVRAELQQVWRNLGLYYSHSEHNLLTETVGAVCGVCRSNTGPSPVTFGGLTFHSPCANLYLHCVEPVLPTVQSH